MSGFLFYNRYYTYLIGIRISGTIGRLQGKTRVIRGKTYYGMTSRRFPIITYGVTHGKQWQRKYIIPPYTNTPRQQEERSAFTKAVNGWKGLTEAEKTSWRKKENGKNIKSGFNYYMSVYMKNIL